jgi:hypothetical protein
MHGRLPGLLASAPMPREVETMSFVLPERSSDPSAGSATGFTMATAEKLQQIEA